MSITSRRDIEGATGVADPFKLPQSIAEHLQRCVDACDVAGAVVDQETLRFLWLDMRCAGKEMLSRDEWLNVVDEAASLGIKFLVACVGTSPSACLEVWDVVKWAQTTHSIAAGIHLTGDSLSEHEVRQFGQLDARLTFLFAPASALAGFDHLGELGIQVRASEVSVEQVCPCRIPKDLVYVGAGGVLYRCGVVSGMEDFCLGHILEKPLGQLVDENRGPEMTPANMSHRPDGCNGCPARMFTQP